MTRIHKAIDCVFFNKNLVNVKLNLDHVERFSFNNDHDKLIPAFMEPVPNNNLLNIILKEDDQLLIIGDNQKVLISFENQRTNQHKISM